MGKRGSLIVMEGTDRTGKTTQTTLLLEKLQLLNKKTTLIKVPDRSTPVGKLINSYLVLNDENLKLSDETAHLLFSANRWELQANIMELLNNGTNVILDRYVYSGVAYSSAKGLDFQWCLGPDKGLPKPDLTIFLTLEDDKRIVDREGYGDERYEVKSFQDKVKLQFKNFYEEPGWEIVKVDEKSIEQVRDEVWQLVEHLIDGTDEELNKF